MAHVIVGTLCSPSKLLGTNKEIVTEVLVSYGGGMGGSNERFYGETTKLDGETKIETFDGKELIVNNDFIVYTRKKQIFTVLIDSTKHANYHKHVVKNRIQSRTTLHEVDDVVEFDENTTGGNAVVIAKTLDETI